MLVMFMNMKRIKYSKIRKARLDSGLTQTQAGKLVHAKLRTWQDWEYGKRPMNLASWELFNIKVKQLEKQK